MALVCVDSTTYDGFLIFKKIEDLMTINYWSHQCFLNLNDEALRHIHVYVASQKLIVHHTVLQKTHNKTRNH